jgi:hypothetical protein
MDLLFHYEQHKKDTRFNLPSYCEFRVYEYDNKITYISTFDLTYQRWGVKKSMLYNYSFIINLENGDIDLISKIVNDKYNETGKHTSKSTMKKNDFSLLSDIIEDGIIRGERKLNFWGVKFKKANEKLFEILYEKLSKTIKSDYIKNKNYSEKYHHNPFFDLIVDFHLDKKNIKGHDNVYNDIKIVYPKTKWLKLNEYKFLPAVLDSLKIKSNYLISKLNQSENNVNILSLKYVCNLFGENYIDYIKHFDWISFCSDDPINKKTHKLKNESEKKFMIQLMNNWEKDVIIKSDSFIYNINKLLSLREKLEKKGLDLKFKVDNDNIFEYTYENWSSIESHLKYGFKMKYQYPMDFINDIETPIKIQDKEFKVKILTTEEDFRVEGYVMKNCLGKEFKNGVIFQYLSVESDKKRVNLQYKKSLLNQSYGKANSMVPEEFNEVINIISNKLKKYNNLEWSKEKYDIIQNK